MSDRVLIQNKILDIVESSEFPIVAYDSDTHRPLLTTDLSEPNARVNEIQGQITNSTKNSGRSRVFNIQSWVFELRLKFNEEVSLEDFLKDKMSNLIFDVKGEKIEVSAGAFNVDHPAQQGAQAGTSLKLTLTANTRR